MRRKRNAFATTSIELSDIPTPDIQGLSHPAAAAGIAVVPW